MTAITAFTHLLALRRGRACYAGPLASGLTDDLLAKIFGAPVFLPKDPDFRRATGTLRQALTNRRTEGR